MEESNDLQFMKDPDRWPRWPLLPVKRGTQMGLMLEHPRVYLRNLWDSTPLADVESIKYDTYESVIADGWIVD
jgi:hypothetical protein